MRTCECVSVNVECICVCVHVCLRAYAYMCVSFMHVTDVLHIVLCTHKIVIMLA